MLPQIFQYESHINLEVVFESYCHWLHNTLQHDSKSIFRQDLSALCFGGGAHIVKLRVGDFELPSK